MNTRHENARATLALLAGCEVTLRSASWIRSASRYLLTIAVSLLGVLATFHYDWPDFVHTDYGFPFAWATHTTVTFAGPDDRWMVRLPYLALDIAFLITFSFGLSFGFSVIRRRGARKIDNAR